MTITPRTVVIRPRDPLIARTARPFQAEPGARAETLPWPLPSTTAGAMRSHIVSTAPGFTDWTDPEMADRAKQTTVRGPLLLVQRTPDLPWTPYLPAPLDALGLDNDDDAAPSTERRLIGARPIAEERWQADQAGGAGCNLPHPSLVPVLPAAGATSRGPAAWWSLADTIAWLADAAGDLIPRQTVGMLPEDVRTHVAIDATRQTNVDGLLFSTRGLVFQDTPLPRRMCGGREREEAPALAIACRVKSAMRDWVKEPATIPLGGERRQAQIELPGREHDPWPLFDPDWQLVPALITTRFLRLQLVTPAIFDQPPADAGDAARHPGLAWLPGWLDPESLTGLPDGLEDLAPLTFRLVGAALGRRQPVSGWSLRQRQGRALRYAVPAGSVYFFALAGGALPAAAVKRLWLRSISDDPQDRRDGFGLAVPGTWQPGT